ncbi:MAG: hypothetical protein E7178_05345 [Erysipelotrichaceae bacterium]|jgi:hypothetical protein|nr:hypothetical protein [Erysipelotrichaceae bacterium]
MNKNTLINLRVNQDLKEMFQQIVERDGFTMSQVIEASMKDVVIRNKIPLYILSKIERKRDPIISIPYIKDCVSGVISHNNKIKSVSLFGSYSKGTATPSSDVDLFVDAEDNFSLFDLADLQRELEKSLGKKVDIVTRTDDEYFTNHIKKEKIQIYERGS